MHNVVISSQGKLLGMLKSGQYLAAVQLPYSGAAVYFLKKEHLTALERLQTLGLQTEELKSWKTGATMTALALPELLAHREAFVTDPAHMPVYVADWAVFVQVFYTEKYAPNEEKEMDMNGIMTITKHGPGKMIMVEKRDVIDEVTESSIEIKVRSDKVIVTRYYNFPQSGFAFADQSFPIVKEPFRFKALVDSRGEVNFVYATECRDGAKWVFNHDGLQRYPVVSATRNTGSEPATDKYGARLDRVEDIHYDYVICEYGPAESVTDLDTVPAYLTSPGRLSKYGDYVERGDLYPLVEAAQGCGGLANLTAEVRRWEAANEKATQDTLAQAKAYAAGFGVPVRVF